MRKERKVNLLFVAQTKYVGGAEVGLLSILRNLDDRYKAIVLSFGQGSNANLFRGKGVMLKDVSEQGWDDVKRNLSVFMKRNKIDVVHTVTPCIFEAAIVAKLLRIPHVWHMYVRLGVMRQDMELSRIRKTLAVICALSSKVIACSKYVKDQFDENGLECEKVSVIYHGVDMGNFVSVQRTGRDVLREKYSIAKNAFLVGMVGRYDPQKRQEDFIEAAALVKKILPRAEFVIVGNEYSSDYSDWLRNLNKKKGNPVILAGFQKSISEVLRAIDLLVMPAIGDAFPLVIQEAMACAKPVVAVNSGGVSEIVIDNRNGFLVDSGNLPALADAVVRIASNPGEAERMGNNGKAMIGETFNIKRTVDQLQDLYSSLIC